MPTDLDIPTPIVRRLDVSASMRRLGSGGAWRSTLPGTVAGIAVAATLLSPHQALAQREAELPRAVPEYPAELASAACTQTVTGSQLQSAVMRARAGAVLCLAPGQRFTGQLGLPQRKDDGWVVIRTAPAPEHPAPGIRIRPSQASSLAQIATNNGGGAAAIRVERGARGWYLALLEVTIDPSLDKVLGTIVNFPRGASDLVLDRVLLRAGADQQVQRCLVINSASTSVVSSWLDECHAKGYDSQAVVSWESDGPVLLDNNTLAGAGENIMLGGADAREPGVSPQDWTITRNHVVTPPSWNRRWTKKNLFETKNARRILVEGNVFEGSWSDGQVGYAFVLKSANQSGNCTWCSASDITIRRNLIRHAAGVFGITGKEGSSNRRVDSLSRRFYIGENWAEEIGRAPYTGAQQLVSIMQAATDITIERNTLTGSDIRNDFMVATPPPSAVRLTFRRNVLTRGRYSLHGCGGPIARCLPGAQLAGNVFVGGGGPLGPGVAASGSLGGALGSAGVQRSVVEAATKGVVVDP